MCRSKRVLNLLAVALTLVLVAAACGDERSTFTRSGKSTDVIVVGVMSPNTGFAADLGVLHRFGIKLAVKEHGPTAGGVVVEFRDEDSKCSPEAAVNAVNRLLDDAVAVIGPSCSAAASTASGPLSEEGIPHIIDAYAPGLTETDNTGYTFRSVESDRFMLAAMVRLIEDDGFASNVAMVRDTSSYGAAAGQTFIDELELRSGFAPAVDALIDMAATDYTGQIQAIRESGAGAAVIILFENPTALFVRQANQFGLDVPLYIAAAGSLFIAAAGDDADGVRFTTRFLPEDERTADFTSAFEAEFGRSPNEAAAGGYLSALAILNALDALSGSNDRAALLEQLRNMDLETAVGRAAWGEAGDLIHPIGLVGHYDGTTPVVTDRWGYDDVYNFER